MFHLSDVMKLQADEKVITVLRRHVLSLVGTLLICALLIILPCFFVFPLFHAGTIGIAFFALPFLLGVIYAWRAVRLWDATALIITDHRLVSVAQRGLWDRQVSEVRLPLIGDVQWDKKGIIRSLFGVGNLRIRASGGAVSSIVMKDVRAPQRFAQLIQELRQHGAKEDPLQKEEKTLRQRVLERVTTANQETLERIEKLLNAEE